MSDDIYLYRLVSVDLEILGNVERFLRSRNLFEEANAIAGVIERARDNKYQEVK